MHVAWHVATLSEQYRFLRHSYSNLCSLLMTNYQ